MTAGESQNAAEAAAGAGAVQGAAQVTGSSDKPPNTKPMICVVPGCPTDVSSGPHYLRRHKICQLHLKAKAVSIHGEDVRFCQQCGRFQPLADFKDDRRSCEVALQAHNARRRVKKDAQGKNWSSERRGRGSKRALAAACPADDPSSSEDGAVGPSRKAAQPRKSSSQRSAPSNLQQSQAGSDSFKGAGSEGNDRPLSDGARTVEQNGWTSHASPDNSYGSPDGLEQQQQVLQGGPGMLQFCAGTSNTGSPAAAAELGEQQQQLSLLQQLMAPDGGSCRQPGMVHGGCGATGSSMLAASSSRFGLHPGAASTTYMGLLQQQGGALSMSGCASMPGFSQAQQLMSDPSLACMPGAGIAGSFGLGDGTLEAWMMPQGIRQQQQAQLQQYWSPAGSAGLEEAMGQSLLLQQALQDQQQQLPHLSQALQQQQQQQSGLQSQVQVMLQQQQQQQAASGAVGSMQGSKGWGGDSSGTNIAVQDASGPPGSGSAGPTTAADGPVSSKAAGAAAAAASMPARSAAAAAALAKDPVFGLLPMQGANSSSSLSLLEAAGAGDVLGSAGPAAVDEDALLEQALDVLLAAGPDWQMDDVLLAGPQAAAAAAAAGVGSGTTHSALAPHATTSSPSSSNINGTNNLSGPLSVPSLPLSSTSAGLAPSGLQPLSMQHAACGLAAAAAGLANATDALRVGSPPKGSMLPAPAAAAAQAQGGVLAAGDSAAAAAAAALDDLLLPPLHAFGPAAGGGVGLSLPMPHAGAGMGGAAAGPGAGGMGAAGQFLGSSSMQMGGSLPAVNTGSKYPSSSSHPGGMFGAPAGSVAASGGVAAGFGSMHPAVAGTGMRCPMSSAPSAGVLYGAAGGAGGVGVAATGPMLHGSSTLGMHHAGVQRPTQQEPSFNGAQGSSLQAMWQQHQQQQQEQQGLLLQQQLLMQQQQQAEYLLLQQQQQLQRRQQLMQLQQQINSTMTYSQQLVRLSIKLHGATPDQLPATTVLAMERLLVNNVADIEMILLQPSLRQGCIQIELDLLVRCPQHKQQQQQQEPLSSPSPAAHTAPAHTTPADPTSAAAAEEVEEAGGGFGGDEFGSAGKLQQCVSMAAVVAALNCSAETAQAEALLRQALPFQQLVELLLSIPLAGSPAPFAAGDGDDRLLSSSGGGDDSDDGDDSSSSSSSSNSSSYDSASDAGSSDSTSGTLRSCAQVIYAQVGSCLGIWRADAGLVQDWGTALAPGWTFGAEASGSAWRPAIATCMPLVCAAAESSAASSPTAAAAAGEAHTLKPLPLKLQLQPAARGSSGGGAGGGGGGGKLQLWCTRRGQYLPMATRQVQSAAELEPSAGAGQQEVEVVAGLLDASPGLLLLQLEQSGTGASTARLAWDAVGCMSGLIPVLLCPSAAMAAECNVHLQMTQDTNYSAPMMVHMGLVLDFWALHQQQQQRQLHGDSPRLLWQEALLSSPRYLKAIKTIGTQLLLSAVISGMTATSAHLHIIMAAVRELQAAGPAEGAAAQPQEGAPAPVAAAAQAGGLTQSATAAPAAAEPAHGTSSASVPEEGSSAAAAAGLKPVQEWVFEEIDCKAGSSPPDGINCSAAGDSSSLGKPCGKAGSVEAQELAAAASKARQGGMPQSPYAIIRGATQMLALLLVMYLLLEVAAALYKGRSPVQQLLASLTQLKELLGIMLVPLAMMCLGAVLAVWQFGLSGAFSQQEPPEDSQQAAGSSSRSGACSKGGDRAG